MSVCVRVSDRIYLDLLFLFLTRLEAFAAPASPSLPPPCFHVGARHPPESPMPLLGPRLGLLVSFPPVAGLGALNRRIADDLGSLGEQVERASERGRARQTAREEREREREREGERGGGREREREKDPKGLHLGVG